MSNELNNFLLEGISHLDISPTMFKEATGHYMAIANLLEKNGVVADFYPQGSFSTGTVVRPFEADNEDTYYDLDMVCLVKDETRDSSSPVELVERVREAILSDKSYEDKCDALPECLTIKYARSESRPGFKLDIVVAVQPSNTDKLDYVLHGVDERWADQDLSIAITHDPAEWMGSNPHALSDWFKEKNAPFAAFDRSMRLKATVEKSGGVYASIEEVPESMERSALQRAIQIAKRSRDVYYPHRKDDVKVPESCMLLALITNHAEKMPASSTPVDILQSFCTALCDIETLVEAGSDCTLISSGRLAVMSPVFPENYLEKWSDNDARAFLSWVKVFREDLSVEWNDLGKRDASMRRILGDGNCEGLSVGVPPVPTAANVSAVKPWGVGR